jgi:hypothetical protein
VIHDAEIAWFAGLLEGEGYFGMAPNRTRGRTERYPSIVIAMCDQDVVERCARLLGTRASHLKSRQEHHKPTYRCLIRGTGAIEWMLRIYPYMGRRRQAKIREIVEEWRTVPLLKAPRMKRSEPIGFLDTINLPSSPIADVTRARPSLPTSLVLPWEKSQNTVIDAKQGLEISESGRCTGGPSRPIVVAPVRLPGF